MRCIGIDRVLGGRKMGRKHSIGGKRFTSTHGQLGQIFFFFFSTKVYDY